MFKKLFKLTSTNLPSEQSIFEKIKNHPVCDAHNKYSFKFNENGLCWVNATPQNCFNSVWASEEDLNDWINGKGRLVKGKTQEEKDKFFKYAEFSKKYDYSYMITGNYRYFNLINDSFEFKNSSNFLNHYIENPLKIYKSNHVNLIQKIFSYHIKHLTHDIENMFIRNISNIYNEWRNESYGIITTLKCLGVGYSGACNSPTDVENLIWYRDVVFSYAYYQALKNQNIELPDFDFVDKYKG